MLAEVSVSEQLGRFVSLRHFCKASIAIKACDTRECRPCHAGLVKVGQIESRLPANIPGTDYPEYPASQPNFSKPERPRAPGYNTATTT